MQEPKAIQVLTAGMDERKQAIFRMAFKLHALHRYRLLAAADATPPDIAIIDMDGTDPAGTWQTFRDAHPALPALLVSTLPITDAPAPVLNKPVRMESLFPLLRLLLSGNTGKPLPPAARPALRLVTPTEPDDAAAERTDRPKRQMPAAIERFDAGAGLLGALVAARDGGRTTLVTVDGRDSLILFPRQGRVLLLVALQDLRPACTGAAAVTSRPARHEDKPKDGNVQVQTIATLIWQVALWSARGRLPSAIDPHSAVRLRHWPNLTRLAPVPDALRIGAFLVRAPAPLRLVVRMLNVAPANLFDFLAAAHSLGLVETGSPAQAATAAVDPGPAPGERPRHGLLRRLLRKVVGA